MDAFENPTDGDQAQKQANAALMEELHQLKHDLDTSSDNVMSHSDEESALGKRERPDFSRQQSANQGSFLSKKRDQKGQVKQKINIEKLMIEHEKKKLQIEELYEKREELERQLATLQETIGARQFNPVSGAPIDDQTQSKHPLQQQQAAQSKAHWDFLIKEMKWMAEDFERETKKKGTDAKKNARACKKQIHEKKLKKERELKDMKHEVKKKAQNMSKMIQQYWRSVEKVVKHNYNVLYEKKRQAQRTKRLESFVSKHLKLSVKVAEELNTKAFVEQSMHKDNIVPLAEPGVEKMGENVEDPSKRRKLDGGQIEEQGEQINTNTANGESSSQQAQMTRTLIAEQTVEMAKSFQPTGTTLASANVKTKVPFLLNGSLREYQIIGLDWLVTLHNKKLNGILADEMGLGKTIQTISMLASLACDKGVWGPHLIVVPTTIIINWEMEFKKWCPGFKILTYYGSQKERKMKRHGWSKENSFHVCITSYKLVIQDHFAFRRKKWYYMILDEAQNIKNFKSQRWQTLLRFNTKRRLLLTGTPLQNDVMELWSLMHFLMPQIFSSQQDFKEWFSNPFNQSITQNQSLNISVVQKLQSILRPFLLRRMKRDVEKQLPEKVEHIVQCNLSRRQRLLYDEYINSDKTKQTLNDSDFFSIMNVLMQLRKVCNHPDLFESRTIESPFIMQERIKFNLPTLIYKDIIQYKPLEDVNMKNLSFVLSDFEGMSSLEYQRLNELYPQRPLVQVLAECKTADLQHLSEHLSTGRPIGDGLAISKRMPQSNSVFLTRGNTKALKQTTLPHIMQQFNQESYFKSYEEIVPGYLNTACLPYVQEYYSMDTYDKLRQYVNSDYLHALKDEEERRHLIRFAQKLIQWRIIDQNNRFNLIVRKPVFGEDCRRAIKVNLVFGDVFDNKRHKNLDRYTSNEKSAQRELNRAPSAVLNPFASSLEKQLNDDSGHSNSVQDFPEQSDQEIESLYNQPLLIKEVPMTLQLSNKQRKHQLKLHLQQLKLQQEQEAEARRLEAESLAQRLRAEAELQAQLDRERSDNEKEVTSDLHSITSDRELYLVIDLKGLKKGLSELDTEKMVVDEGQEWKNLNVKLIARKKKAQEIQEEIVVNTSEVQQEEGVAPINQEAVVVLVDEQQMQVETEKREESVSPDTNMIEVQQTAENNSGEQQQDQEEVPEQQEEGKKEVEEVKIEVEQAQSQSLPVSKPPRISNQIITYRNCEVLRDLIVTPLQRVSNLEEQIRHFKFIIPKAVARPVDFTPSKIVTKHEKEKAYERFAYQKLMSHRNVHQSLRHSNILFFPHKNLIQYDCGKLQRLATLLKNLHQKGHKVLIFTQMTRILDVLENFLNLHGYTYVRLDGSVKVEMRQRMVDRFNLNKKIFCFISSTRCGGIGINLTGADCVIFYDTDWNPAMDKQAQDRCHRIGQTKTVHIYRLISVNTIEENIFKKSLQKRDFGGLIIEGNFDMEIFMKRGITLKDILEDDSIFRPKRRDLLKEENIVFHTNTHNIGEEQAAGRHAIGNGEDQILDYEKQRELDQYRKRFEEALVRIEDKEDVIALQQARREIDDEFDEEAIAAQEAATNQSKEPTTPTTGGMTEAGSEFNTSTHGNNQPDQEAVEDTEAPVKVTAQAQELENRSASMLQKEMLQHKSDFINYREHPTLNNVTKLGIQYFENNYSFDAYLEDRSKKDNKFVNPLEELGETNKKEAEEDQQSEFSMSGAEEDEEMSQNGGGDAHQHQHWQRSMAEQIYKSAREDIEHRYTLE